MVTVSPGYWPQSGKLGADCQVEKDPKLIRRHRMYGPPEYHHRHADHDNGGNIELAGPRQRAKWGQDAEILDGVLVSGAH